MDEDRGPAPQLTEIREVRRKQGRGLSKMGEEGRGWERRYAGSREQTML